MNANPASKPLVSDHRTQCMSSETTTSHVSYGNTRFRYAQFTVRGLPDDFGRDCWMDQIRFPSQFRLGFDHNRGKGWRLLRLLPRRQHAVDEAGGEADDAPQEAKDNR